MILKLYFKKFFTIYNTIVGGFLMIDIATPIPRYNKNQLLLIDGREIKLIDHLKELRLSQNLTKKKVSNLVKQNDYWYSQVERDGKNGDDARQKTIYRPDLVNVISIVKYGAKTSLEMETFKEKSEVYLDKIIGAVPLTESVRKLQWYDIHNNRTPEEQERLLNSLLESLDKQIRKTFDSLSDPTDKDNFLNALKNCNASTRIDTLFMVTLAGLPYMSFLYESKQEELFQLLRDVMKDIDSLEQSLDTEDTNAISRFRTIEDTIEKYIHTNSSAIPTNRYNPIQHKNPSGE